MSFKNLQRNLVLSFSVVAVVCSLAIAGVAQQAAVGASTTVPKVVNFSGTLTDLNGKPLTGITGVTFLLYKDEQGGAPLWLEPQNVRPDKYGHYSVTLGSTSSHGLPEDVFVSGEARWLGVQIEGQQEQPRVLLVAVPYALKAHDAETIGGLPPSAFMLAAPATAGNATSGTTTSSPSSVPPATITGSGTTGFLPEFTGASSIANSAVFQTGTSPSAKIGINTNAPGAALDVVGAGTIRGLFTLPATGTATAASGKTSQPQDLVASAFNSGTSKAVAQTFQFKAEPINNNTANPSGTLNLLFASGTGSPAETGFKISNTGVLTFVATQKFPGTGSVTSVGSGAGLTGGPITTSGTLSIANAGVTNTMLQHSSLTITAGTDLKGGGAVSLGGSTTLNLDTTKVPQLATNNTYSGSQTINNNLTVTGNEQFTGPIQFTDGSGTEIINAIDCCNFGTRMIWAHSPAFPTWGIFYDDSVDFMHWRTAPGGELLTADFPDHRVGINNVAPAQALDVVGNIQSSGVVSAASDVDAAGNANVSGFISAGGDIFGFIGSFASDVDLGGNVNASGGVNASGRGTFGSSTAGGQIVIANNNGSSQALQIQNFASPVGGFTEAQFDVNGRATFFTDAFGDTTAVGTKSAAVPLTNGSMVKVFSTESPEVWFEDYGFGQLASGASKVTIDPSFAQTANMAGYHVFVTPKGDCKGLYVTNETGTTFEVRELEGGQSNIAFDYRIVAHRKGYETVRLPAAHMPKPQATPALVAAKAPVRPPLVTKLAPEPTRVNPQSLYRTSSTVHKQVQKH